MTVCVRNHRDCPEAYLIVMRGADKDDWTIVRDVESTAGAHFSEEYLGDYPPKHQRNVIRDWRHVGNGTKVCTSVLCVNGHEERVSRNEATSHVGRAGVNTAKLSPMRSASVYYYANLHACAYCTMSGNRCECEMKLKDITEENNHSTNARGLVPPADEPLLVTLARLYWNMSCNL